MNTPSFIEHEGIIKAIDGDCLKVLIHPVPACGSCAAKGMCPVLEGPSEKIIDIIEKHTQHKAGDRVIIIFETVQGLRAVALAYVLPFVLLFLILIVGRLFLHNELILGLAAVASLIPYYGCVYAARKKIEKTLRFRLKEPSNL